MYLTLGRDRPGEAKTRMYIRVHVCIYSALAFYERGERHAQRAYRGAQERGGCCCLSELCSRAHFHRYILCENLARVLSVCVCVRAAELLRACAIQTPAFGTFFLLSIPIQCAIRRSNLLTVVDEINIERALRGRACEKCRFVMGYVLCVREHTI